MKTSEQIAELIYDVGIELDKGRISQEECLKQTTALVREAQLEAARAMQEACALECQEWEEGECCERHIRALRPEDVLGLTSG